MLAALGEGGLDSSPVTGPHSDQRAGLSIKLPGSRTAKAWLPAPRTVQNVTFRMPTAFSFSFIFRLLWLSDLECNSFPEIL